MIEPLADEITLPLGGPAGAISHLSLRYSTPPEAPLCLLYLHGFGSHQSGEKAEFFRQQAGERGLAFCSLDFEGHGRSGGTMRGLTLSRNLANIERALAFLAAHGHQRICLVGSSMGGGAALWYAALHPGAVVAGMHIAPALALERSLLAWAGPEGARRWQQTGVLAFHNDFVTCDLDWQLITDLRRFPEARLYQLLETPTLILQGRLDSEVSWQGAVDLLAHARGAVDLHLFADGDHRLTDRKQRIWALMLEFLSGRRLLTGAVAPAP
jgi:pimeloyl-ACP methyl ester carboxylesterase